MDPLCNSCDNVTAAFCHTKVRPNYICLIPESVGLPVDDMDQDDKDIEDYEVLREQVPP